MLWLTLGGLVTLAGLIGLFFGRPFAILTLCQGGVIVFALYKGGVFE